VADEPEVNQDAEPAERPLVVQPHGGALRPFLPGVSGNPAGKPSNRERMARELIRRQGLGWILELARQARKDSPELVEALLKAAKSENGITVVAAQRLIADLLDVGKKAIAEVNISMDVEVRRKVRDMTEDGVDADPAVEPREVECEVVEEGLPTADSVGNVDNSGAEIPSLPRLPQGPPQTPPRSPHLPSPISPLPASQGLVSPPIGGRIGGCGRRESSRETPLPPVAVEVPEWLLECGEDGEPLGRAGHSAVCVTPSVDPQRTTSAREGMSTGEPLEPQEPDCALPDPEEGRPRPPK